MPTAQEVWNQYRNDPNDSMRDHMDFLRILGRQHLRIMEIGIREGSSTASFLLGLRESNGHLWSVDKEGRCWAAVSDGGEHWTFIHADSRDAATVKSKVPPELDILMIDGWHDAEFVRADLENYTPLVRPGGFILMHDVAPSFRITPEMMAKGWHDLSGVRPAFDNFVRATSYAAWIQPGRFGLGIIQKRKTLIAVLSCERDRALNQALRETCYRYTSYHRFFVGYAATLGDEVSLDCLDDYGSLAAKCQAMARWALAEGYDVVFKTDADTYVDVARLMRALQEPPVAAADYCGFYKGGPGDYAKGLGYWMSRKALEIVADLPLLYSDDVRNPGPYVAEDRWVGHWLMQRGLTCILDERYRHVEPGPEPGNEIIAVHRRDTPEKIYQSHARRQGRSWPG